MPLRRLPYAVCLLATANAVRVQVDSSAEVESKKPGGHVPLVADTAPLGVLHDFMSHSADPTRRLEEFMDSWEFFDGPDPTMGHVEYVNRSIAQSFPRPLVELDTETGSIVLQSEPGGPMEGLSDRPKSLRLQSKFKLEKNSLIIADFAHMPDHCGAWPAFWLLGDDPWPENGEVDIIENVGGDIPIVNEAVHTALHTSRSCNIGTTEEDRLMHGGIFHGKDCAYKWGRNNAGCVVLSTDTHSFGRKFNNVGGGVYALLWTESFFEAWFWQRQHIPTDITENSVSRESMSKWGQPYARFHMGDHCHHNNFRSMQVVLNTDFCGGFAGATFNAMCFTRGVYRNGWHTWHNNTSDENCVAYLEQESGREHIKNDARWEVQSMKVYDYEPPRLKVGEIFSPLLTSGTTWCREPTLFPWQQSDLHERECVGLELHRANRVLATVGLGSMFHREAPEWQVGYVENIRHPSCAAHPDEDGTEERPDAAARDEENDPHDSLVEHGDCYRENQAYGINPSGSSDLGACGGAAEIVGTADGHDPRDCQLACRSSVECSYWEYVMDAEDGKNACRLKSGILCGDGGYSESPGLVAGPKLCPVEVMHRTHEEEHDFVEGGDFPEGHQHHRHYKHLAWRDQNRCFRQAHEYGNWYNGACASAPLVGLYASAGCVENVVSQAWWNASAPAEVREINHACECQEACQNTDGCAFWQFDTRPGLYEHSCWMKGDTNCGEDGYTSAIGWVTGPRECPEDESRCKKRYVVSGHQSYPRRRHADHLLCFNEDACPEGCAWEKGRCLHSDS